MADALPGLGIVAAVLGVVISMGALGGPPEEIGHKVAAALVGTFLGILLCYGLVGPIASNMSKAADEEHAYYHVLRVVIVSFMKGTPPTIAVEFARRAIPGPCGHRSRKPRSTSNRRVRSLKLHRRKLPRKKRRSAWRERRRSSSRKK
jgi:flagellar motor component MotA